MKSTTTKVFVAKAFAYAHDGKTIETLAEGAEVDIQSDLVDGLKAEGFITLDKPKGGKGNPKATQPEPQPQSEPAAAPDGAAG